MVSLPHRFFVRPRNGEAEETLVRELGIPRMIAALLAQRGITEPEAADKFLNPSLTHLHDPRRLPDYESAQRAILGAKERGELIFIHGDYDADGVTSAAILQRFLAKIGARVHAHVPHREREGYGIHTDTVTRAHEMGAKLLLTSDCGIGAHATVDQANELGMTVVVTDHHAVGDTLPNAAAVINPHRTDSDYPFEDLCGAGVALKLCEGLSDELGLPKDKFYKNFMDLAAIGTIADVMPLVDENRVIAHFGLRYLAETKKAGLRKLMELANVGGLGKPIRSFHIGFVLGPRLNAVGRVDDAGRALQLLLETDDLVASTLAQEIEEWNDTRKATQADIVEQAVEDVFLTNQQSRNVIVVARENWHTGIVGIAAGKIVEQFRRPAFVLAVLPDGTCKGSARSIPAFDLARAIREFPNLLNGGGHAMAAGCSFAVENLDLVRETLNGYASQFLKEEDFIPATEADIELSAEDFTIESVEMLNRLEPFGNENPEPRFLVRNARLDSVMPCRNPLHIKSFMSWQGLGPIDCIAWNAQEMYAGHNTGDRVDALVQVSVNEYNGRRNLQWNVKELASA